MQPERQLLGHIKQVAEQGIKHSKGTLFPIDRMVHCFEHIIKAIEDTESGTTKEA